MYYLETGSNPEKIIVALGMIFMRPLVDEEIVRFAEDPLTVATHEGCVVVDCGGPLFA